MSRLAFQPQARHLELPRCVLTHSLTAVTHARSRALAASDVLVRSLALLGKDTTVALSDVPRSRLVKYPLLLKSIAKYTPKGHSDYVQIEQSIETIEDVIKLVDERTGLSKCEFIKSKLEYLSDDQVTMLIQSCIARIRIRYYC